jgi:predicted transcriptional regulator
MTCPKQSITLRRDLLNKLNTNPNLSVQQMKIGTLHSVQKILNSFEELGLIEVTAESKIHTRNLTEKGKEYMQAFNEFYQYLDAC